MDMRAIEDTFIKKTKTANLNTLDKAKKHHTIKAITFKIYK